MWRYKGRTVTLRSAIYLTMDDPAFTRLAKAYSIVMMLLILLVTVCFVLESEALAPTGLLAQTNAISVFEQIELVSVSMFTAEYILRFATFPIKKTWWRSCTAFVLTPFNLIDALACFPFWVTFIMTAIDRELTPLPVFERSAPLVYGHSCAALDAARGFVRYTLLPRGNPDTPPYMLALHVHLVAASASSSGFGFVRAIRLVRVTRIFKIGKYSVGIQMFLGAMSRSVMSLSILLVLLALGVILVASVMSLAEGGISDPSSESYDEALLGAIGFDASAHQICFGTIPRCFWWALVTMTTVGYVRVAPIAPRHIRTTRSLASHVAVHSLWSLHGPCRAIAILSASWARCSRH